MKTLTSPKVYKDHIVIQLSRGLIQQDRVKPFDKLVLKQLLMQEPTIQVITKLYSFAKKYRQILPGTYNIQFDVLVKLPEESFIQWKAEESKDYQVKISFDRLGNERLPRMKVKIRSVPQKTFFELLDLLKSHDFVWEPGTKTWEKVLNTYILSDLLNQPPLKYLNVEVVDKNIEKELDEIHKDARKAIDLSKSLSSDIILPEHIEKILFPYQKVSIEYSKLKVGILLADEMGLGKSLQALCVAESRKAYPLVIVCPANLKLKWAEGEIRKWFPEKKIQILYSKDSLKLENEIFILNYDILKNHTKSILETLKPKAVIFDESHMIKSPKAKRSQLALRFKSVPLRMCLTGTPVINKPLDLIHQLQVLDCLKYFGGVTTFKKRYCNPQFDGFRFVYDGVSNVLELQQKLRQFCMIRREKSEVLTELPEKIIEETYFELDNIKEYKKLERDIVEWWREKVRLNEVLTPEQKKAYLDNSGFKQIEEFTKIEYLKQASAKFKLKQAIQWIDNTLEQKKKLIIFAHHIEIIDSLHNTYKDCSVVLKGGMNKDVQNIVNEFKNNSQKKLFIGSLMAAGTGLDLQFCDTMAFLELPWTWAHVDQAMSRIHRIGQKESCNYYFLLAKETIDEKIWKLILSKRELMDNTTQYNKLQLLMNSLGK